MIRFANPGSDISSLTRIFQALFEELQDAQPFSLDDISTALVQRNLATSCGYTGNEALNRSTRKKRSNDPLYNQSKMYSELFRLLGWLHPTPHSRLTFVLTWLGAHVAAAGPHAKQLVRECVLGIVFPNDVLASKGDHRLRPFPLILRSMAALGGLLCRDEMIVGPLSLDDDTDPAKVQGMIARIAGLRTKSPKLLDQAVAALSTQRGIQENTLENYTRFPLAVLEWSGWTDKVRDTSAYGQSLVFHRLTQVGLAQVQSLLSAKDVRAAMLVRATSTVRYAAAKLGAVSMLERSGFDASGLAQEHAAWGATLAANSVLPSASTSLLFAPFQELPPAEVLQVFGAVGTVSSATSAGQVTSAQATAGRSQAVTTTVRLLQRAGPTTPVHGVSTRVETILRQEISSGATIEKAADCLVQAFAATNKAEFYPAVSDLFRLLGYDCGVSRAGVNYQRWDAFITHVTDSVPMEIKSPGEEEFMSVKGVRQALENKIILLSRGGAPTRRHSTSLLVGFAAPSDRAEVAELVADIEAVYGIAIGVIDFKSLAVLAAGALSGSPHDSQALLTLKGFIDVATA